MQCGGQKTSYFRLLIPNLWNKRFEKYVNMVQKARDYESLFKITQGVSI